MIDLYCSAYNS